MTDNKLADALRDIQQYLQMTAPSPDCGHLLQITVDALAAHDAPDECFCDRMYPDSNPNASCGDCPTRDYGAQPAPAPVQVDGAGELPPLPAAEYRVSPDSRQPSLYDEDALRVFLRDYEMTHGTGDLEMQPALHQARKALARHDAEKGKADGDYVLVPRWKLARAAAVVMRDGDEHGVGADIEAMLSAAPANPPAPEPQTTPNDTRVTDEWPTHRACTPYKNGSRIVGFVINEGDPAWGEIGLSEPLFWLDRMCKGQSVPLPAEPVADETESLLRRAMDVCLEVVKGGKLAAHNAANLRNHIDRHLRHATIAALRQPVAGTGDRDAIDDDNGFREYPWTYENQPGNVGTSALGACARNAQPGGDSIDHGLSLLRELHQRGLGIVRVPKLKLPVTGSEGERG